MAGIGASCTMPTTGVLDWAAGPWLQAPTSRPAPRTNGSIRASDGFIEFPPPTTADPMGAARRPGPGRLLAPAYRTWRRRQRAGGPVIRVLQQQLVVLQLFAAHRVEPLHQVADG